MLLHGGIIDRSYIKQGKSEGFDRAATGLVILLKLDSNRWFFSPCDFQIWWMTRKTLGHLFYTTSCFEHCFKAIGEFKHKLHLQSGNAQSGSKSEIFVPYMTLKFVGWPWKTIGNLFYTKSSFVHCLKAMGEFKLEWRSGNARVKLFFVPCDLEFWNMTLKNNRAPLLCYFKLCASFQSHLWIQTWVTVRLRIIVHGSYYR